MPRFAHSSKVREAAGRRSLAFIVAVTFLVGCAETSLNEAPVIDRSARPGANVAPVRSVKDDTGSMAGQESASDWYTVQKGDTLFHIGTVFHCSVQDLARWNAIAETAPLATGQRLRVRAPVVAATYSDTRPPSIAAAAIEPADAVPAEVHAVPLSTTGNVETRALDAAPGATVGPSPAIATNAASPVPAAASAARPLQTGPAQAAPAPNSGAGEQPALAAAAPSSAGAAEKPVVSGPWIWPVDGRVTATFDAVHTKGIEIAANDGAKIVAVADGEVSYTGAPRDYGNLVIVRHPDGLLSVYAHAKAILVAQGQSVKRGQAIATAGKTDGGVQNLHFEVRRKGVPIDPLELLPAR